MKRTKTYAGGETWKCYNITHFWFKRIFLGEKAHSEIDCGIFVWNIRFPFDIAYKALIMGSTLQFKTIYNQ